MSSSIPVPVPIQSVQNSQVKRCVHLRSSRARGGEGCTVIDGRREIRLALTAGVVLERVFYLGDPHGESPSVELYGASRGMAESARNENGGETLASLLRSAQESLALLHPCAARVFEKLCYGNRTDVVAIARSPRTTLGELAQRWATTNRAPLVAILEAIEKPGNVGAVMRSADGAGLDAVIVVDGGTDLYNPNAIRASLGTIFTTPVVAATFAELADWLPASNLQLFLARVDGAVNYATVDYRAACAIVLGSEARGLSLRWDSLAVGAKSRDQVSSISIPMLGVADSLNVSATAAVLFYEAVRQRSRQG